MKKVEEFEGFRNYLLLKYGNSGMLLQTLVFEAASWFDMDNQRNYITIRELEKHRCIVRQDGNTGLWHVITKVEYNVR